MFFKVLENLGDLSFLDPILRTIEQKGATIIGTEAHIVLGEGGFHGLGDEALM